MRLTILNQFYTPDVSPTAHLCASLAEHRAKLGDEVTVVSSRGGYVRPDSGAVDGHRADGVTIQRVWTPRLGKTTLPRRLLDYLAFSLLSAWRLATLPRQDVIVALTTPPFIAWAAVLHKLLHRRSRLVLWNMDSYPEAAERAGVIREGGLISRLLRAGNRWLFRHLDHLVALDEPMQALLLAHYGPCRGLTAAVIPNWERRSEFPGPVPKREWTGRDAERLHGRFVILYGGNLGQGHAFETVLSAARALGDEPVAFWFVGGGSAMPAVDALARRHGLSNIVCHPYVSKPEMQRVMAAADAALITLRDGMLGVMSPSKLHGSLAMGLPILYVGPAESNVDEAIARFRCGASIRHAEVDALVSAVRRWANAGEEHARLRRAARAAFESRYNDEHCLRLFDRLLDRAAHIPVDFAVRPMRRAA